jgi:serine/threonine-protein kinase
MAEAHRQGIVHRDLKPSNLFLATEGDQQIVKVLDFGIVKEAPGADVRLTSTHTTMGTPLYMAPEQFRSAKEVDARADVWALGATLYELLAGAPPFTGTATTIGISVITDPLPPIEAARPDLPAALRAVIEKALEKEPDRRFPSAMQLGEALAPWDDSGLVPASLANVVAGPGFASSGKHPARVALESAHTLPGVTVPDERSLAAGTAATQALPSTARTAEPASSAEPALAPAAPAPVPRSRAPWLLAVPLVVAAIGVGGYLAGRPDAAARATPLGVRSAPPDLSTASVAPPPTDPRAAPSAPAPPPADPRAAPSRADPFSAPVTASATTAPSLAASSSASHAPVPSARPVSVRSAATRPPAVPSPSASTAPLFFPR